MKYILPLMMVIGVALTVFSVGAPQTTTYTWKELNVSIVSSEKLEEANIDKGAYTLSSDNLSISFSILEGMDGVGGLKGSLESYAKSFYKKSSSAVEISGKLKKLKGASLTAQSGPAKYIMGMYCYPDLTHHFICTIEYKEGYADAANKILKSMKLNDDVKKYDTADNDNKNAINKNTDDGSMKGDNKPKPVYDKVKIALYGNPVCLNTVNVRERLDAENIKYSFFDVESIQKYKDEMYDFLNKYGYIKEKKFPISIVGTFVYVDSESDAGGTINLTRSGSKTTVYGNSQASSKRLKQKLDAAKIKYTYIDIDKNPKKIRDLNEQLANSHSVSYPVAVINNTLVYNASLKFIDEIIDIAKGKK
jgi:arsenate reductase-like glutaredoxin family protein